jgi:uncharacterized protein with PQ loop repeat
MTNVVGWVSSLILLTTIVAQVRRQWVERSGKAGSRWLFIGQTAASFGFTLYSVLVHNWVFTITNGLLLLSGITGWAMNQYFRSEKGAPSERSLRSDAKAGAV